MSQAPAPAVKIGCILPLSGFERDHARTQLLAVQLAFKEAPAQVQLSCDVQLVVEDDAYDRQRAAAIARTLAADPDVLAVIGPMNSDMTLAAAPFFHAAGLVHIATASSNADLSQRGWRTFFRMVPSDAIQAKDAARFAVRQLSARRIAIVQDGSNWSRPLAESFRDAAVALAAEVPAIVAVERGRHDYGEAVAVLAAVQPDLIFFAVIEAVAAVIKEQVRQVGILAPFMAPNALKPFPYLATPGYDVDGPYYTSNQADWRIAAFRKAGEMVARYVEHFGEEPTVFAAEAYDAAMIVLWALRKTNAIRPTREEVLKAVAATSDFDGTSGRITFDSNGDILRDISLYKVEGSQLRFLGFASDLVWSERVGSTG